VGDCFFSTMSHKKRLMEERSLLGLGVRVQGPGYRSKRGKNVQVAALEGQLQIAQGLKNPKRGFKR